MYHNTLHVRGHINSSKKLQTSSQPFQLPVTEGKLISNTHIARSTGFIYSPWLHISRCNPKRAVSLSEIQPPLALKLHQTLSKNNTIDLALRLFRRTWPEEWSLKPGYRPICKLRLIRSANNRIFNTGVDGRTERPCGIDKHLTNRVLSLRISDSARRHGVVDEQPGSVSRFDWRRTGFEKPILPRVYWCRKRLSCRQSGPVEKIGRSRMVE